MFLEQQISILEWFLKDCVTLKTGEMAAENSALPFSFTGINYILKCLNTKQLFIIVMLIVMFLLYFY